MPAPSWNGAPAATVLPSADNDTDQPYTIALMHVNATHLSTAQFVTN
jgi:hypothetical protein